MSTNSNFSISYKIKSLPKHQKIIGEGGLFYLMKEAILGTDYELSLAFVSAKEIQSLNKIYRNIDEPTDILSFPLSKKEGEILICEKETKRMMKEFDLSLQVGRSPYENFLCFLFIHGLVHLKGYDHGANMEKVEQKFRRKFKI